MILGRFISLISSLIRCTFIWSLLLLSYDLHFVITIKIQCSIVLATTYKNNSGVMMSRLSKNKLQLFFEDEYGVIITGPQQKVIPGTEVVLTCFVTTKQHPPTWLQVRKTQLVVWNLKPENITLPGEGKHFGIHIPIMNVTSTDAGYYTCEAFWKNPGYAMDDTYTLQVACKSGNYS